MRPWGYLTGTGVRGQVGVWSAFWRRKKQANRIQNIKRTPSGTTSPRVPAYEELKFSCFSKKLVIFLICLSCLCTYRVRRNLGAHIALLGALAMRPQCRVLLFYMFSKVFIFFVFLRSCGALILIRELGRSKGLSRRHFLRTLHGHFGKERRGYRFYCQNRHPVAILAES